MGNFIQNMEAEQKCGFNITQNRKKLWECELKMYSLLSEVCSKNSLKHFLLYGAAIGAMRHNGFIPWDDDLDVGMLREDFECFRTLIASEIINRKLPYSVVYGVEKDGIYPLLRIRDNNTTGIISHESGNMHSKGAFIEVYVFDRVPESAVDRDLQHDTVENWLYILNFKVKKPKIKSKDGVYTAFKSLTRTKKQLWDKVMYECQKYSSSNSIYYNLVQLPLNGRNNHVLFQKEWVESIIEVPFEKTTVSISSYTHQMLTQCYGDYMSLPPIENRGIHHQTTVFYDPVHPYTYYDQSDAPERFFRGEMEELI